MKKPFILLIFLAILAGCSSSENVKSENRMIREQVVAVKSEKNSTILSSGRYDKWYLVHTPLTEGMTYEVLLDIPRQRENAQLISAELIDFSPGVFLQRDVFARYKMAYNQVSTGNNFGTASVEEPKKQETEENRN